MISPETLIGKQIDHFRLEDYIARGAMGMVFRAMDSVLARTVALKLIPKTIEVGLSDAEITCREEALKRLIQEAKAAGKLAHPNIVTIHSYGETEEFKYICMEYISGKTLAQVLRQRGKIPVEDASPILDQILMALDAAYDEGIVHRDIKPANIMITKDNLVKVMDFGIAKLPSLAVTLTGMILGTPYYMSPEQISGKKVDIRSDLFSVGTLTYEMLTGEMPFEGESTATLLYKIIQVDPVSPRAINESIPESLARIVSKAMAKDPAQRYQSPREMLNDLRGISQPSPDSIEVPTVVTPKSTAPDEPGVSDVQPPLPLPQPPEPSSAAGQIQSASAAVEPSSKMQDMRQGPVTGKKNAISTAYILALIVVVAGAVFTGWYLKGGTPPGPAPAPSQAPATIQETTPPVSVPSQAPATIQETTPPVSAPPADIKPVPSVESLLLEAGRQFTSNPETAQKLLEQALSREPNNYDCSLSLARLFSYRKNYAAAIRQYQHALSIDNRGADVHYELGCLFLARSDYDSAIESFNTALVFQPKNTDEILSSLGFCYYKKGDFTQARLFLAKSLESNPDNTTAKAFMAILPQETKPAPATRQTTAQPPKTLPPPHPAPVPSKPDGTAAEPPSDLASKFPPATIPPKVRGAEALSGQWIFTITVLDGKKVTGQVDIEASGNQLQMVATASYWLQGQDGFSHQFHEKNYFAGTLRGQNITARCDRAEFTMDGRQVQPPYLPLKLSLVLKPDNRSMRGTVSNSAGTTTSLQLKRR